MVTCFPVYLCTYPMKILSVFGTRPEAVKMAPIVRRLRETAGIESCVCVTAQHRQMLDQVLELFEITPEYDLDLMRENQSMAQVSVGIFTHLDPILEKIRPDWILAVGDTTTVVTTSLLAFYRRIKFGHVEAGLRTHNKWHPFPEEINRRLATTTADLHFAPTEWSRNNLLHENVPDELIFVTGNPVIDALTYVAEQEQPAAIRQLVERLEIKKDGTRKLILVTAHRRENFGEPFENICHAIKEIATRDDVEVVYPVHLNPNVQEPVNRILKNAPHVTLLPPLDYLPMVHLMKQATIILTDSVGFRKKRPLLESLCWSCVKQPSVLKASTREFLKLVGTDQNTIVRQATHLLDDPSAYTKMAKARKSLRRW